MWSPTLCVWGVGRRGQSGGGGGGGAEGGDKCKVPTRNFSNWPSDWQLLNLLVFVRVYAVDPWAKWSKIKNIKNLHQLITGSLTNHPAAAMTSRYTDHDVVVASVVVHLYLVQLRLSAWNPREKGRVELLIQNFMSLPDQRPSNSSLQGTIYLWQTSNYLASGDPADSIR